MNRLLSCALAAGLSCGVLSSSAWSQEAAVASDPATSPAPAKPAEAPIRYLVAGKDFQFLTPGFPVQEGRIEVLMFFWFGSDWAARAEPLFRAWIESGTAPSNVSFKLVPIVLTDDWAFAARVFFALDEMKLSYRLAPALLRAVSTKAVNIQSPVSVRDWLSNQGVDVKEFQKTINSPMVVAMTSSSPNVARLYQVQSTPTVVVNGKYHISANEKVSPERVFAVTKFMVESIAKQPATAQK